MTRYSTFGYMTGMEMETYLDDSIQNDDVSKLGTYDEKTDDVDLTLCPTGCGGPIIGHIYNDNDDCARKVSSQHKDLTTDESDTLIENIKSLPSWKKAKML